MRAGTADQRAWVESLAARDLVARGDPDGARARLSAALAEDPPTLKPALTVELAEVELAAGRTSAARRALRNAAAALAATGPSDAGSRGLRLRCAGLEVDIGLRLGQHDIACSALERAAGLVAADEPYEEIDQALRTVNVALALEDFAGAIEAVEHRLPLAREHDAVAHARLLVRRGIAESEWAREGADASRAEATLRAALGAPGLEPAEEWSAVQVLADLALRRGDPAAARAHLERSAVLAQGAGAGREEALAREAALRVALALSEGAPLAQIEHARASLAAALSAVQAAFERERDGLESLGFLSWGTQRAVLSELVRAEIALGAGAAGAERALAHVVRAQGIGGFARELGAASADLAAVRAELAAGGAGVLVFLPAMDRTHVFALGADLVVHAEASARDRLVALGARELVPRLLTHPARDRNRAARAAELTRLCAALTRELLPEPIRARIAGWSEVRVAGAELCGLPPIELLELAPGLEIGLEKPVSYLPSLPAGVGLARRAAARTAPASALDLVAVVDPRFDPELATRHPQLLVLDLRPAEIERILGGSAPLGVVALIGPQATRTALRSALDRGARMLTILAHGLHAPLRDQPAGLALAPEDGFDGALWCDAVRGLRAPPFVVLLACGTARGRPRLGDDVAQHLGGAFLSAGADCVLATRGEIALGAALTMAERLHELALRDGAAPAVALLDVRRALARDPSTADPFYRAGPLLLGFSRASSAAPAARAGDTTRGEARSASRAWPVLSTGALALAIAVAVGLSRRRGSDRRRRA